MTMTWIFPLALTLLLLPILFELDPIQDWRGLLCTTGACILWLIQSVLYGWHAWQRYRVPITREAAVKQPLNICGGLYVNPSFGVCVKVFVGDHEEEVLVNPDLWWAFGRSNSFQESAVAGNPISPVPSGKEAPSYVLIKQAGVNGNTVGAGVRVIYNGASYLLTANHVWNGKTPDLELVKRGVCTPVGDWPTVYGCADPEVDFVMVDVPSPVWSALGVKAAKLDGIMKRSTVTVTGGTDSQRLFSSLGYANMAAQAWKIEHTASTYNGWSGAPLYDSRGTVIGVHLGTSTPGELNRAVNVYPLLSIKLETYYEHDVFQYVDEEGKKDRDPGLFREVDIKGVGKVMLADREYTFGSFKSPEEIEKGFKRKAWSSYAEEEPEEYYLAEPIPSFQETVESHLNSPRAAGPRSLPPLTTLAGTSGAQGSRSPVACRSPSVEDRLASLEKLMEITIERLGKLTEPRSPNSGSSTGHPEAPPPSLNLSPSRPEASLNLRPQTTLMRQSKHSAKNTLEAAREELSKEGSGKKRQSRKRSRKSRKGKSTQRLPLASPSPK